MIHRKLNTLIAGGSIYMIVPDQVNLGCKPEPIILLALPIIPFRISQNFYSLFSIYYIYSYPPGYS